MNSSEQLDDLRRRRQTALEMGGLENARTVPAAPVMRHGIMP